MGAETINNSKIEQNKFIVLKYYDDVLNKRKLEVLHDILHSDFKLTEIDDTETSFRYEREGDGIEEFQNIVKGYLDGFSNLHCTIITMIADEDVVLVHWVGQMIHDGIFFGLQATGKRIHMPAFHSFKMKDGLIQDIDFIYDSFLLFTVIGHAVINLNEESRMQEYFAVLQNMGLLPEE